MKSLSVGTGALVVGFGIAAFLLVVYQDWWAIAFAIGGVAIAWLSRGNRSPERAMMIGIEISGAVLLALVGLFAFALGAFGPSRPCDGCASSGSGFSVMGIVALVAAVLLAGLAIWQSRSSRSRDIR